MTQGVVLAGLAIALFSGGIGLALIPGGSSNGIPTYPFFVGRGWSTLIECMIALSAAFSAIAVSSLSRRGTLITFALGVGTTFLGVLLFFLTQFIYTIPARLADGTTIQVQSYPQVQLVLVWGLIMLLFLPISYMIVKKVRARAGPSRPNNQTTPENATPLSR
jgi:hypothetical protein